MKLNPVGVKSVAILWMMIGAVLLYGGTVAYLTVNFGPIFLGLGLGIPLLASLSFAEYHMAVRQIPAKGKVKRRK